MKKTEELYRINDLIHKDVKARQKRKALNKSKRRKRSGVEAKIVTDRDTQRTQGTGCNEKSTSLPFSGLPTLVKLDS